MTREELARQKGLAAEIIAKYHGNFAELQTQGTSRELKTFMMYIANNANHLQRVTMGLDDPD
ncbi:hypothetical protein [Lacticaseibacillus manihotivorans]|jgi:hypothetical protein|uniref:Uncharacterized protein n=2 Tax=Lacticaseibacillus manihotivorans TaxID=88233 RepID=A0A0R1R678_9LACO|nr:hypothetical protein [Lacticaseibacillus manihotivorans]KRL52217.1 hypothetical protein FD01_GL002605 [Lacticaseibacillus manihotivorans DSM 13343 = JCM 12514]QFQ91979.1 hypothetical protein LM010_11345 [Lacticaseibacillus manihotivorans]